jgi:hypothetical protein
VLDSDEEEEEEENDDQEEGDADNNGGAAASSSSSTSSSSSLLNSKKHKCARKRKVPVRDLTKGKGRVGGGRGNTVAMKKRKNVLTRNQWDLKLQKQYVICEVVPLYLKS